MCDPILVTLLKIQSHDSQSSRENATPSSGTSPLASYKKVAPGNKMQNFYLWPAPAHDNGIITCHSMLYFLVMRELLKWFSRYNATSW